jgi:hypothetical protein
VSSETNKSICSHPKTWVLIVLHLILLIFILTWTLTPA